MNPSRFISRGIILSRTNFGEADRILTILTPDNGKLRAIAKGSRKSKSKLAAGIEPFSITDLTVLNGKGEVRTLMSTRLQKHFGNITSDLKRLEAASASMRLINKNTEDEPEPAYYYLLEETFEAFNNINLEFEITEFWFNLQLLKLAGHAPNLRTDTTGQKLSAGNKYNFDVEKMAFFATSSGKFGVNHIKFLRLAIGLNKAEAVARIKDWQKLIKPPTVQVQSMLSSHLRI